MSGRLPRDLVAVIVCRHAESALPRQPSSFSYDQSAGIFRCAVWRETGLGATNRSSPSRLAQTPTS